MPRKPIGPHIKPLDVEFVVAESKHAVAQAFSLKASVNVKFSGASKQPVKIENEIFL